MRDHAVAPGALGAEHERAERHVERPGVGNHPPESLLAIALRRERARVERREVGPERVAAGSELGGAELVLRDGELRLDLGERACDEGASLLATVHRAALYHLRARGNGLRPRGRACAVLFQRTLKPGGAAGTDRRAMAYRSLREFLDRLETRGRARPREGAGRSGARDGRAGRSRGEARRTGAPLREREGPGARRLPGRDEPVRDAASHELGALVRGLRGPRARAPRAAAHGAPAVALGQAQDAPEAREARGDDPEARLARLRARRSC